MRKQGLLPIVIVAVALGGVTYFGPGKSEQAAVDLVGKCVSTVSQMWDWIVGMFKLT